MKPLLAITVVLLSAAPADAGCRGCWGWPVPIYTAPPAYQAQPPQSYGYIVPQPYYQLKPGLLAGRWRLVPRVRPVIVAAPPVGQAQQSPQSQ